MVRNQVTFATENNKKSVMKQLFVLLFLLWSLPDVWGQAKTYTLKECVEIGIHNNLSLRNSRVSVQKSQTALTQSRARLLPVLSADFQMVDYLQYFGKFLPRN